MVAGLSCDHSFSTPPQPDTPNPSTHDGRASAPAGNQGPGQRSGTPMQSCSWEVHRPRRPTPSPSGGTLAFSGLSFPEGWGQWLRHGPPLSPCSGRVGDPEQSLSLPHSVARGWRALGRVRGAVEHSGCRHMVQTCRLRPTPHKLSITSLLKEPGWCPSPSRPQPRPHPWSLPPRAPSPCQAEGHCGESDPK